jgi:hypothetical protein
MAHVSRIVKVTKLADGLLGVRVRCCNDPSSDSILTLHELHRDDAEIDSDIQKHQAKVEKLHEAAEHQKRHIERLTGK